MAALRSASAPLSLAFTEGEGALVRGFGEQNKDDACQKPCLTRQCSEAVQLCQVCSW